MWGQNKSTLDPSLFKAYTWTTFNTITRKKTTQKLILNYWSAMDKYSSLEVNDIWVSRQGWVLGLEMSTDTDSLKKSID